MTIEKMLGNMQKAAVKNNQATKQTTNTAKAKKRK